MHLREKFVSAMHDQRLPKSVSCVPPDPPATSRMRILPTSSRFPRDSVAILAAALLFAACDRSAEPDSTANATPEQPTAPAPAPAAPPKLTPAQLAEASTRADFFFLDVRSPEEIGELGTLPGYVNIPIEELEGRLAEIPPGMAIVTA